ncbi:MAG: DUF84 family protein [Candidatus Pacebacteria bacterium]|nr:DUF84 family protein [Candidatus Paceibacterota bacterium]
MIILLGSESGQKIKILREALENLIGSEFEIVPIKVDSGITGQPLDFETTVQGSENRARGAARIYGRDFDFSFGMEAGLELKNGVYDLVCSVAVIRSNGSLEFGRGGNVPLPKEVSDRVVSGAYVSDIIREYRDRPELDVKEKTAVEDFINRRRVFISAINDAWKNFSTDF